MQPVTLDMGLSWFIQERGTSEMPQFVSLSSCPLRLPFQRYASMFAQDMKVRP